MQSSATAAPPSSRSFPSTPPLPPTSSLRRRRQCTAPPFAPTQKMCDTRGRYCATAVAALLGAAVGTWLRQVQLLSAAAATPAPKPLPVHCQGSLDGRALRSHLGATPTLQATKDTCANSVLTPRQVDAFIFLGVFGSSGGAGSFAAHAAAAWVFWASSLVLALVIAAVIAQPQVVQVDRKARERPCVMCCCV